MNVRSREAALRQITRFYRELQREARYHRNNGYVAMRWSSFSQDWNRRQQKWRSDKSLFIGSLAYQRDVHRQALTGPAVALFSVWRGWHNLLDWERTRYPGVFERVLAPTRHSALEGELRDAIEDYHTLYTAAKSIVAVDRRGR